MLRHCVRLEMEGGRVRTSEDIDQKSTSTATGLKQGNDVTLHIGYIGSLSLRIDSKICEEGGHNQNGRNNTYDRQNGSAKWRGFYRQHHVRKRPHQCHSRRGSLQSKQW
jgi:hypothetical protein